MNTSHKGIQPGLKMIARVCLFLIGTVCISHQTSEPGYTYISELMVESNTTLEANIVMSVLSTNISVNDSKGVTHWLTFQENELVSECLILDKLYECRCSAGYMWTNDVCYNYGCCNGSICKMAQPTNFSLNCIAKVQVLVSGSVQMLNSISWSSEKKTKLENSFQNLSGWEQLNITKHSDSYVEFKTVLSIKPMISKVQEIVGRLEEGLPAKLWLTVEGLVNIESPLTTVHYQTSPQLKCTFDMNTAMSDIAWYLNKNGERTQLNNGSVLSLQYNCYTQKQQSCTTVTVNKVTGPWEGTYECTFAHGSVNYTAKAKMNVALLPDEIEMDINPLTVDCTTSPTIKVNATIKNSSEIYNFTWKSNVSSLDITLPITSSSVYFGYIVYMAKANVSCKQTTEAQYVSITFTNSVGQNKTQQFNIPVIYENTKFCKVDEQWPKTPEGNTVIIRTCAGERVGYMSRTCEGNVWQPVFNNCKSKELSKVLTIAEDFEKGLGSSTTKAIKVFEGLKNFSKNADLSESIADVIGSISVLDTMAIATTNFTLNEEVFPDFVGSASNILNSTWKGVNKTFIYNMSSTYLKSVESLVKNIKVKKTSSFDSPNIKVSVCRDSDCNATVFDINVNLNNGTRNLKTVGVKNLMNKLRNDFRSTTPLSDKLIIATVEDNRSSAFRITLEFPNKLPEYSKAFCVFWDTIQNDWSDKGCTVKASHNNYTLCECNHLTSFSILMGKSESSNTLDIITYVGLAVSICSLLIFLMIECLVWSAVVKTNLSHFRHTSLVNIATFRLLADCSFLASSLIKTLPDEWCLILTICKHLFYLAMFCWMLCLSGMLVHQLIFVFSPLRKRVFMFLSSIIGYVCPLVIVGSSYLFYKYTNKEYYDKKTCWLVFYRVLEGSLHTFLLPIGTITFINLFFMVVVILTLIKTSIPDGSKSQDKETAKSIFKVILYLTPVFGITWGLGFLMHILHDDHPVYTFVEYSFTILNTFQGLFILITGCLVEAKVREELILIITGKKKEVNTQKLTSTTCSKTT